MSDKIFAVSMVRDEVDIIAANIEHLVGEGVDGFVIADNLSNDGTRDVLEDMAEEVRKRKLPFIIEDDPIPGYYQSKKMTALAQRAAAYGATWIVPFDADELWCGLRALRSITEPVVALPSYTYIETGYDVDGKSPFESMLYHRPQVSSLPKVCYRYDPSWVIAQGNDGVLNGLGAFIKPRLVAGTLMRICHFPMRGPTHFMLKMRRGAQAMKDAPDLPENLCAHWRAYGRIWEKYGAGVLQNIYFTQYFCPEPWQWGLVKDPAPIKKVWS